MQTRAAVAWKAGAPLTIETVDLEGPRAGEVLVLLGESGAGKSLLARALMGLTPPGLQARGELWLAGDLRGDRVGRRL